MIRELFYIRKSDRRVLLSLLVVVVVALGIMFFVGNGQEQADVALADSLSGDTAFLHQSNANSSPIQYRQETERTPELFPFDPNTADSTQLLRLGLQPWQVRNVYRYRASGGIYRRPADFARLYGLTVKQYRRLEPYIRISSDYQPASTLVKEKPIERDTLHYPVKIKPTEHVVLNMADTAMLRRVPGIGVYYAKEIARYGRLLGGYVSVDQLDEIDNFPKGSKKYFTIENASPQKLNLNRLSLNELKRHPYINFYQAKAITDYRRLRGPLHSLQDLRLLPDFTPEAIAHLEPYVEF